MKKLEKIGFYLLEIAKDYSKMQLSLMVMPSIYGDKVNEESIRKVLEPYIDVVDEILSKEIKTELNICLESFLPEAIDHMYLHSDMHCGDNSGRMNMDNANAFLFMFLHWSCDLKGVSAEYLAEY